MPRDELLTLDTVLSELGEDGKPLPRSTFHDWRAPSGGIRGTGAEQHQDRQKLE